MMNASAGIFEFDSTPEIAQGAQTVPEALVQKQLDRIINSRSFKRSSRLRSLLQFVVQSALDGQPNSETRTARELLGKNEDFDPSLDPMIRVNFGRLRRALMHYYATEGNRDEVLIDIPNRKYSPVFAPRAAAPSVQDVGMDLKANGASHLKGAAPDEFRPLGDTGIPETADRGEAAKFGRVSIAVLPFANLTNDTGQDTFCYGLTAEISNALAVLPEIDVVASSSAFQFKDEPVDVRAVGHELGVPLVLEGSVRIEEGQTRIVAQLARTEDGVAIWSDSFDGKMDGSLNTQKAITEEVIRTLPLTSLLE